MFQGYYDLSEGRVIKKLIKFYKECGYKTKMGILQAGYYGLPQNRWRVFLYAVKKHLALPEFPYPTHEFPRTTIFGAKAFRKNVVKPPKAPDLFWRPHITVTVGDAISDLPKIENGGKSNGKDYKNGSLSEYQRLMRGDAQRPTQHVCAKMGPIIFERIAAVPRRAGAGWLDLPDHLKPRNLARHGDKRYDNRFGRLHWKGTFNTILTRPYPYWSRVIHPEQDRVISVRECARAQGFPDSVQFYGRLTEKYKQIGNAVPNVSQSHWRANH